ncbi:MAG: polysaccharide biosynthesis tyrosine autokinase [bacterium]
MKKELETNPPHMSATPSLPGQDSIDWREYFHAVVDRLWIVILCVVLGGIYAGVNLSKVETKYRARAVLFIEQDKSRILDSKMEQVRDEQIRSIDMINTVVDLLRSYPFAQRVSARLKLDQDPRFLAAAGISARDASPDRVAATLSSMSAAVYRTNTRLIDLLITSADPNLSVKLANAYCDEYIRYVFERRSEASKSATQFLLEEADRLRKKMRVSEEAMQSFRERERAASIENMLASAQAQLSEVSIVQVEIQKRIQQIDSDLAVVRSNKGAVEELLTLPSVAAEPKVIQFSESLNARQRELTLLSQRYRAKHPAYIAIKTQIDLTKSDLRRVLNDAVNLLENARNRLEVQAAETKLARERAEARLLEVTSKSIEYNDIKREQETDQALYNSVLSRLKEVDITKQLTESPVRIHEPAVGSAPIRPSATKTWMQTLMGAAAIGIAIAIGLFMLDSSIKTVDQVEQFTGVNVIAAIPKLSLSSRASVLVTNEERSGVVAESFRSLRASLTMHRFNTEARTYLFTSSMPSEGKTFCSSNFAVTLAQQGYNTLFVDADLRKPGGSIVFFGENRKPGLSELLIGSCAMKNAIMSTEIEGLSILTAGGRAPNPSELLTFDNLQRVFDEALSKYDRIVIDSAPLLAVSDTLLVAPHTDLCTLVVRAFSTPRKMVARAIKSLEECKTFPAGLILNFLPSGRGGYYAYYYSGKYYGSYGSKGVYGE